MKYLFLFIVFFCLLHFSMCMALGRIVQRVFARGTNCEVYLENPQISYFPLRGTIENVKVYHPEEGSNKGYRASKITAELEFLKLFKKKVVVPKILIEGSEVTVFHEKSALYQILRFLFSSEVAQQENKWHSFFSSGWRAWVPVVEIKTPNIASTHFQIGTDQIFLSFEQVEFFSRDPIDDPNKPVFIEAVGKNAKLVTNELVSVSLGDAKISAKTLKGIWEFSKINFETEQDSQDERGFLQASGQINTNEEGRYEILGDLDLGQKKLHDHLGVLFERFEWIKAEEIVKNNSTIVSQFKVSGELLSPVIEGSAVVESAKIKIDGKYEGALFPLELQIESSVLVNGFLPFEIELDVNSKFFSAKIVGEEKRLEKKIDLELLFNFASKELSFAKASLKAIPLSLFALIYSEVDDLLISSKDPFILDPSLVVGEVSCEGGFSVNLESGIGRGDFGVLLSNSTQQLDLVSVSLRLMEKKLQIWRFSGGDFSR
jgi:hypothetical protein